MLAEAFPTSYRPIPIEGLVLESSLRDTVLTRRLQLRDQAIAEFPDNPLSGLKMGHNYRDLSLSIAGYWRNRLPGNFKDYFSLAAFGSTGRGELCFHSDIDVLLIPSPRLDLQLASSASQNLENYLTEAGLKPEVKVITPEIICPDPNVIDLVGCEIIATAQTFSGQENLLKELIQQTPDRLTEKAVFAILEHEKPRQFQINQNRDIFNIKWKHGGLIDFMTLRTIARSMGISHPTTQGLLMELKNAGSITGQEMEFLLTTLSEYLLYRNEMHIYAGEEAELLGPKTRRYICEHVPFCTTPDNLASHLEELRSGVSGVYAHVRNSFLQSLNIDPELLERFPELPVDQQIAYAQSDSPFAAGIASWNTSHSEVLEAALNHNPDWSVLQAVSRSELSTPRMLHHAEQLTRNSVSHAFTRMMITVNTVTDMSILQEMIKNTKPNSQKEQKVIDVARKRLAFMLADSSNELSAEQRYQSELHVFYPTWGMETEGVKSGQSQEITPGKIYLNFVGRLSQGKNLIPFLQTAYQLHKSGVNFESHIFGSMEMSTLEELHNFWSTVSEDVEFMDKIKYHGQYNQESLKAGVNEMSHLGHPVFLFTKGLVSKELLAMGQKLITTNQGNWDLESAGLDLFDQNQLEDSVFRDSIGRVAIKKSQETSSVDVTAVEFVENTYNLTSWGGKFINLMQSLAANSRQLGIIGENQITAAHGPASWSRNLLEAFSSSTTHQAQYSTVRSDNPIFYQPERVESKPHPEILEDLEKIIELVLQYKPNGIPDNQANDFLRLILDIARHPQTVEVLTGKEAGKSADKVFSRLGLEGKILYPVIACDEVTAYGRPVRPMLKLAHIISLLQTPLPQADVYLTSGPVISLTAVREKIEHSTPTIYVEHILASNTPFLDPYANNPLYDTVEKTWFTNLHGLISEIIYRNLDAYVALWPVNQKIAADSFHIPDNKIIYIPNAVNTNYLRQ